MNNLFRWQWRNSLATGLGLLLLGSFSTWEALAETPPPTAEACLQTLRRAGRSAAIAPCREAIDALITAAQVAQAETAIIGEDPPGLGELQQALILAHRLEDPQTEVQVRLHLGDLLHTLGRYPQAQAQYESARSLARSRQETLQESAALNGLGRVATSFGQPQQAIAYHQQALQRLQGLDSETAAAATAATHNDLGDAHRVNGDLAAARSSHEAALALFQSLGNSAGEAATQLLLGRVSQRQRDLPAAIAAYETALDLYQTQENAGGRQAALTALGGIYHLQERYAAAIAAYEEALTISRDRDRLADEATLWQNIALSHTRQRNWTEAINAFQEAATRYEVLGYRALQGESLSNIATVLEKQGDVEMAIAVYKSAVNVLEAVRQDLRVLPLELQETFPRTFAGTYRALADLLLAQDRVIEAQQVLDLLKVQEIDDYLHDLPTPDTAPLGATPLPSEAELVQRYDQTIAQGRELAQLRQIAPRDRTQAQQQRIAELVTAQQQQVADFNTFINSPEVQSLIQQLDQRSQRQNLDLRQLNSLQDNLRQLDGAVLLYPLILPDRLELVLVTPNAPPIHRAVSVSSETLHQAIADYRQALTTPGSDVLPLAQQLHNWLIQPITQELSQANAQTIFYAPDGKLRYLPLAALHDGQQWLVERFRTNHITAASLTDFDTPTPANYRVLAAAFSQGQYQVQVGNRQVSLQGLPYAGIEVETLAAAFPEATTLLNQSFSRAATVPQMDDHSIVHLATHAEFFSGEPEASFILFGDGTSVTLRDIATWTLRNVELMVLSACQTGIGGTLGNGEEILGFGYQLQRAGARSAIASLWSVDDGGTQALMTAFYDALSQGNTKTDALRQAQLALITDDQQVIRRTQRSIAVVPTTGAARQIPSSFSHPYYWAPFILIGNGR